MTNKLWGGRFQKKIDAGFEKFSASFEWDKRLCAYDLKIDAAYVKALKKCRVLSAGEAKKLLAAVSLLEKRLAGGILKLNPSSEDVHSAIQAELKKIAGVINIQDDRGESADEWKFDIDKKRAALYGISALDISLIAKAALEGVVATQYREGGKEYDVRVRLSEVDRSNIENLNHLLLYSHVLDTLIALKDIAVVQKSLGPSEINRSDQERTTTISADILKTAKSKDVLRNVQKLLSGLQVSPDFQVQLSGKAREVKENFSQVTFAFALAILLVYMIMASQFESFLQPLIIMLTVPLALFGVAIALIISGTSLNVISLLGMVLLAGTAVNNGIVLIEYTNQAREEGLDVEHAAILAAKIRTRPIIVSALTSVMGLIPLALGLGEGAELRAPMAISMMGGTISSTALTLVIIPLFYIFITRITQALMPGTEEN